MLSRLTLILFVALAIPLCLTTAAPKPNQKSLAPQRLRLRVQNNTLRPGDTTKIYVDFLDRDYQQVPTNVYRLVSLRAAPAGKQQTAVGEFYPQELKVGPGGWSAEASFVARQPGKLLIVASSDGLDSAQVLVMVVSKVSFLSRLLETVAYAEEGIEIIPKETVPVPANNKSQALFFVSLPNSPDTPVTVRVLTKPATEVIYQAQKTFAFVDIKLDKDKAVSDQIGVISETARSISVEAWVLPRGTKDSSTVQFTAPRPSRIVFDAEPQSIESCQRTVPITVQLADADGLPVSPDQEHKIQLSSATGSDFLTFSPPEVTVSPTQPSAEAMMKLSDLPDGNELKLLASAEGGPNLRSAEKRILIKSPIEKLMISGPTEIDRNGTVAQFTIHLLDKDGRPAKADWRRSIDLNVDGGSLDVNQIVIPTGEEKKTINYTSPNGVGKFTLTAYSSGIAEDKKSISIITPAIWLIVGALLGGVVGGFVRHMRHDFRFERVKPRFKNGALELGLPGRIASSIVSGLILYWALKLGLSKAFGAAALPGTLELGTRTASFFFGVVGGYGGTVVLDKLVGWLLPDEKRSNERREHKANRAHAKRSGEKIQADV